MRGQEEGGGVQQTAVLLGAPSLLAASHKDDSYGEKLGKSLEAVTIAKVCGFKGEARQSESWVLE